MPLLGMHDKDTHLKGSILRAAQALHAWRHCLPGVAVCASQLVDDSLCLLKYRQCPYYISSKPSDNFPLVCLVTPCFGNTVLCNPLPCKVDSYAFAARLKRLAGGEPLFRGMAFWLGSGYKGQGVSPHQLADMLTWAGGQVLGRLPPPPPGLFVPQLLIGKIYLFKHSCMHSFAPSFTHLVV